MLRAALCTKTENSKSDFDQLERTYEQFLAVGL